MSSPHLRYYGLKGLSILGLFLVTFALPHAIPGPTLDLYESRFDDADQRQRLIARYGFDRPLAVQYGIWIQRLATGQWGISRYYHRPVFYDILRATGFTLFHLSWTAVAYAIWTAVITLLYRLRGSLRITPSRYCNLRWIEVIPNFFIALIMYEIAVWELGWADLVNVSLFEPTYYRKPLVMFIPASVLALTPLIIWHTRTVLGQPAAQSGTWKRYLQQWQHFSQLARPLLGAFLMELLLTEYVFTLPGLGSIGLNAIRRHDFPLLQGFLLATGSLYIAIGILLDQSARATQSTVQPPAQLPLPTGLRRIMRPLWGLIILFALASWGPALSPHDATEIHTEDQLRSPGTRYMLGTDFLGRDVLSRTMHGFRTSIPRVLLITLGIAALSGLISALLRHSPPAMQRLSHAMSLLFEALPPFLLTCIVFLVVERQFQRWSLAITLSIAGLPVGLALFRNKTSRLGVIANLASIGELILILDVIIFYLRLSPEPITPTWGGDIRIGAQYSHINIWSLLSPIIAVAGSRMVFHQLSICGSRSPDDDGTTATTP